MEEYKEKYEMALEGIQEILDSGEDSIKMSRLKLRLQGIFPELTESEDERIRKSLISHFRNNSVSESWSGINVKKVLAWLEKQGEEKSQSDSKKLSEQIKDFKGEFCCWNSAQDFRPKHLQRCLCYDKYMKGVYCYVYDDISKYWCTQTTEEHDPDGDNHICDYADYRVTVWMQLPDTSFYPSKSWLEKQGEQKPDYCHHEVDLTNCSEEYRKAYYDGWNNCNMQYSQCKSDSSDVVKCLINGMKFYYEDNEEATWGTEKFSMKVKDILAWLEKQVKQKSADEDKSKYKLSDLLVQGDWIVRDLEAYKNIDGDKYDVWCVNYKDDKYFICDDLNGNRETFTIDEINEFFRLWDMSYVKPGDILAIDNSSYQYPFVAIYKEQNKENSDAFDAYCFVNHSGQFYITNLSSKGFVCSNFSKSFHPATKKERELLFSKMANAGYVWDSVNRQLKSKF